MGLVSKTIKPLFAEIGKLLSLENVSIVGMDHIPTENRISKAERKLQLSFDAVLDKELHHTVEKPSFGEFFIHSNGRCFVVSENNAYFEGYSFMTTEEQTFTMNISSLKDTNEQTGYIRMAVPIKRNFWVHNLHTYGIQTETNLIGGLLILNFDEGEVHVFTVADDNTKQQYMIVEPQFEVTK